MTDYMIMSGARALASLSPALKDPDDSLLPDGASPGILRKTLMLICVFLPVADMRKTSMQVTKAVMMAAKEEGVARVEFVEEDIEQVISNVSIPAAFVADNLLSVCFRMPGTLFTGKSRKWLISVGLTSLLDL